MHLLNPRIWLGLCLTLGLYKLAISFDCDDGCEIPDEFEQDGYCDCTDCSDESSWTCDTCADGVGCADTCNSTDPYYYYYLWPCNISMFFCDDGCAIYSGWVNDSMCECSNCEDEPHWTCDNCTCPDSCGDYSFCGDTVFVCNDGCEIYAGYENDDWCDCNDCEDESQWSCDNCTCPDTCGEWYYCGEWIIDDPFVCDDGCQIYSEYENDGWCDCSECEDEDYYTCESCGCPTQCYDYVYCGNGYGCNNTFSCSDGCNVPCDWVNDNYCDCSDCGDEISTGHDCDSCGGCPTDCGDWIFCDDSNSGSADASTGVFDQTTDAGRAALAFLIIGIIVIVLVIILVSSRTCGYKNTNSLREQKQGIIDLDGNAEYDNAGGAMGTTGGVTGGGGGGDGMGMNTNNGTLSKPQSEKPPSYEQAKPVSTWNEMIDLPPEDNPKNTNDDDSGEVSVQQGAGGTAGGDALPQQAKTTAGNDDPFA